jgi:hypothetical protein
VEFDHESDNSLLKRGSCTYCWWIIQAQVNCKSQLFFMCMYLELASFGLRHTCSDAIKHLGGAAGDGDGTR